MEELIPILEKLAEAITPLSDAFGLLSSAMGPATQAASAFSSGIKEATGLVTGAFGQMVGAIEPFVAVLNPSVATQMNGAMKSLQATIGVALVPAAQAITGAMKQVAGALLPAAQALAPVLANIARVVTDLLLPPFYLISDVLTGLAPVFELLSGMAKSIADGFVALSAVSRAVIQAFTEWISSLFGGSGNIKDFLSQFRDAVHRVVQSLLQLSAYIARYFGRNDLIGRMANNLRELANPRPGASAAPTETGFKGFEDIAKTMAVAAFAAMGGGNQEKSEKEWLAEMAKNLDEIAKSGETLEEFWDRKMSDVKDWITIELPRKFHDLISGPAAQAAQAAAGSAVNAVGAPAIMGAVTASPAGALAGLLRGIL